SGQRFDTLSQPQAEQYSVAFSPDGRFIYGSGADSRIRQWQLTSRQQPEINPLRISRFAHEGTISLGIYNKSGTLVRTLFKEASDKDFTVGLNGFITQWDGKDDAGQP
ncbi:MAG: hypothetical protein ACKPJJ_00365, partial [Planctomycetaceae bacterium]